MIISFEVYIIHSVLYIYLFHAFYYNTTTSKWEGKQNYIVRLNNKKLVLNGHVSTL